MKTLTVVVLLVLCAAVARAQDVPSTVVSAFQQRYAAAHHTVWDELEEGEFTATFVLGNVEMSVRYNAAGEWLSATVYLEESDVPSAVRNAVATQFPEYDMYDVVRVEDATAAFYEMTLESEEDALVVQVATDGRILKKEIIAVDMD
ncbi:MAG: PepSY-like domain-containing protein [Bacteroidota bacterium]|jgi:predicted RNA-binding protein (virulence factor B family)|nr:PepSY-like domain-containing protein [Bacteroidota bacterium]